MLAVFKEIKQEITGHAKTYATLKITPHLIKQVSEKQGLKINLNKLIVEFKGGGIISPHINNPTKEGIAYEVNPRPNTTHKMKQTKESKFVSLNDD